MTAIAAVIALSSTPLIAQGIDAPALTTPAPAAEVTPTPAPAAEATPAPVAADPIAAEPVVADTPSVADPLAATPAKPAARKATAAKTATPRSRPAPTRTASAAPAVAAAPVTASVAPVAETPVVEPLPVQPEAVPVPAPIAEPPAPADTTLNSMIPIAGIGALGILALTGAGLVVRRRRRRAEDADDDARRQYVEALPEADTNAVPAMIAEPEHATPAMAAETAAVEAAVVAAHEPSPEIDGPVTELPEDFDLSRFGLHTQAAYNGPTEDNPSLSLKHRLSRASGMDQMAEREAEAEVAADLVEAPAADPAVAPKAKGDFMLARGDKKPSLHPA